MPFNVLDRRQKIHRSALLEASAGTGKTFAIENIFLRLLIESPPDRQPLSLENILVVTFTKAATRDLKERIRSKLERSLGMLKHFLSSREIESGVPDYLLTCFEQGHEAIVKAKKLIEKALFSFDRAQIFTIHGFCWRMLKRHALEAGISFEAIFGENSALPPAKLMEVVRDFLRTELIPEIYSPQQLNILLKKVDRQIKKLQEELLKALSRGIEFAGSPSFSDHLEKFKSIMLMFKNSYGFESEKIIEDFLVYAPSYNGLRNQERNLHPEVLEKIQRFASLFDKSSWDACDLDQLIGEGIFILEALDPSRLGKKGSLPPPASLHYPNFLEELTRVLFPIVSMARNESAIFANLCKHCQVFIRRYFAEEEVLGNSELLLQMEAATEHLPFVSKIRQAYHAVIVDEFQDTDPIQWKIFDTLFADAKEAWHGCLYLVGDPKQSIYAFRQADIYTYLQAAKRLGDNSRAFLDVNYRSDPLLIQALNALFSASPDLFTLPRIEAALPFKPVHAGKEAQNLFSDKGKAFQIWAVKEKSKNKDPLKEYESYFFLPAIVKELINLKKSGWRFEQTALLVADRFQAERVRQHLQSCGIPVKSQRGKDLSKSLAVDAMRELLTGILYYRKTSALHLALSGRLIGMDHLEVRALKESQLFEKIILQCDSLRHILLKDGFGLFYSHFMQSKWHQDASVFENLLQQYQGDEFYREWQDIADILSGEQARNKLSAEELLVFLDNFDVLSRDDDERVRAYVDKENDGVVVLTTHVSKGLEFDIVFALGLMRRSKAPDELVLMNRGEKQVLETVESKHSVFYKRNAEEIDAEKMRQFYVALTRAKHRVYLPMMMSDEMPSAPLGTASPNELFACRIDRSIGTYEELYNIINKQDYSPLVDFVSRNSGLIGLSFLQKGENAIFSPADLASPSLCPPKEVFIPGQPLYIQSFTSIIQGTEAAHDKGDEELSAPFAFDCSVKTKHSLPSGNQTGIFLHKIFEAFPFGSLKNASSYAQVIPFIRSQTSKTSFIGWEEVIAEIVFKALKTNLPECERPFCLADVDSKKIYRETEFQYSCSEITPLKKGMNGGYLKGVIDLFFEHEGKYYLLDWKSNWLGPDQEYYQRESLKKAMLANGYDLQAVIYTEALKKYLKIFDKRPFDEIFGGAFYFFLRGIDDCEGIFHFLPHVDLVESNTRDCVQIRSHSL